jgi:hypothetical protein
MVMKLEFDFDDFVKQAAAFDIAADQMPYAFALALNRAADVTRNLLIQTTWPQHIKQRNQSFIAASLTTRDARASKQSLSVEIYDKLDRGNLQMQAKGGTRAPMGGSNLAVPASDVPKTSRGVPSRLRPKNMPTAVRKGDVLYARDKKNRLKLLYVLKPTTKIPRRVPFYEDFATSMFRELARSIPIAINQAMATRRK